jgi:hypothetical protein
MYTLSQLNSPRTLESGKRGDRVMFPTIDGHMNRTLSPDALLDVFHAIDEAQSDAIDIRCSIAALACLLELNRKHGLDLKVSALKLNMVEAVGRRKAQTYYREHSWPTDGTGRGLVSKILADCNLDLL